MNLIISKSYLVLSFIVGITIIYLIFNQKRTNAYNINNFNENNGILSLKSECSCKQNEIILIVNNTSNYIQSYSTLTHKSYTVAQSELNNFSCEMFNTLRRGRDQKVIGLTLYGKKDLYYDYLKSNYIGINVKLLNLDTMNQSAS